MIECSKEARDDKESLLRESIGGKSQSDFGWTTFLPY